MNMTDKIINEKDTIEETQSFKPVQDIPMNNINTIQQGWQCPVCGRILAPFVTECPCSTLKAISKDYMPKNNINLT